MKFICGMVDLDNSTNQQFKPSYSLLFITFAALEI